MLAVVLIQLFIGLLATVASAADIGEAEAVICTIVKNEEPYIDEWLRYHRYLGFDRVHLYDNADVASSYLAGLHMVYGDFVQVKHFPGFAKQYAANHDFLVSHHQDNTWVANIDADEFIVLRKHSTIKHLLRDLAPSGGGVVFNWRVFSNEGVQVKTVGPVVSRFTFTTKALSEYIKSMSYLPHVIDFDVHNTEIKPGHPKVDMLRRPVPTDWRGNWVTNQGNEEVAYLNHYHTKSLEEYLLKKHRGLADRPDPLKTEEEFLREFDKYNEALKQVEDTSARDFYLKHCIADLHGHKHVTKNITGSAARQHQKPLHGASHFVG